MAKGVRSSEWLRELLRRISRDEGSYRAMAQKSGVSLNTYSRVVNEGTGMASATVRKFTVTYGQRYGFTQERIFAEQGDLDIPDDPEQETDPVPQPVRVGFQRARGILTEEKVQWMGELLAGQIAMLIERLDRGELDTPELLDSDPARR